MDADVRRMADDIVDEEDVGQLERELAERMGDQAGDAQNVAPVLRAEAKTARAIDLVAIWAGANIIVGTWAVGALATTVFGLDLTGAVSAIIVGNLLGGTALGVASIMGKIGAPQMMLGRYALGTRGNNLPSFFNFVSNIGWFSANTVLVTLATYQVLNLLGIEANTAARIVVLVGVLLVQVLLGLTRFELMKKIEHWLVWPMAVFLVFMTFRAFADVDWSVAPSGFATGGAFNYWTMWVSAVGAIGIGYLAAWAPYASDFTRFYRFRTPADDRTVFWVGLGTGFVVCTWLELIGASFATVHKGIDPAVHIANAVPAFALPALVIVLGGLVSTNILNLINGSLSAKAVWRMGSRVAWTWVIAAVGSLMAFYSVFVTDVASMYKTFLLALLIWEAPWMGVLFTDFFVIRRQRYRIRDLYGLSGRIPAFNSSGLVAYLIGLVSAGLFSFTGKNEILGIPLYSPLMLNYFNGGDISYFVGFIVSAALYYSLARRGAAPEPPPEARPATA
jgi:nucleobase:cation symporter-1, NCS1 family